MDDKLGDRYIATDQEVRDVITIRKLIDTPETRKLIREELTAAKNGDNLKPGEGDNIQKMPLPFRFFKLDSTKIKTVEDVALVLGGLDIGIRFDPNDDSMREQFEASLHLFTEVTEDGAPLINTKKE